VHVADGELITLFTVITHCRSYHQNDDHKNSGFFAYFHLQFQINMRLKLQINYLQLNRQSHLVRIRQLLSIQKAIHDSYNLHSKFSMQSGYNRFISERLRLSFLQTIQECLDRNW